jgi:hypothetical protein
MARTLNIYPKALIEGSVWTYIVKTYEPSTRVNSRFVHTVPAGVTADIPLSLLKLSYDLVVGDADTDGDVDTAHFVDTAASGPTNGETLWETWQTLAETVLAGLSAPYTQADYYAEWSKQDTQQVRQAGNRILVNGRGWTIPFVHQHEGDGTTTDG